MSTNAITSLGVAASARHVHRSFGDRHVLRGLDLDIGRGEFVALLGRSGSGKSTFLRAFAGLDSAVDGEVRVPPRRSVVFQDPRLLDNGFIALRSRLLGELGVDEAAEGAHLEHQNHPNHQPDHNQQPVHNQQSVYDQQSVHSLGATT